MHDGGSGAGEGFAIDASVVKADANRQRGVPSTESVDWTSSELSTRAVQEYLQALEQDGQVGATPMNLSLTDPAARWTAAPGGPAFYAYCTNYLIDVHAGVIVDVEATAAHRIAETEATKIMVDRVEERFDLKPKRLIGDTAYGSAPLLNWMVEEKKIEPTFRCGRSINAPTARYRAMPSVGTKRVTNTAARKAIRCAASGVRSQSHARISPKPTQ